MPQGDSYQVSVATQPPDQYCTVAQGSGTAQASVSNVAVTCAAGTASVLAALPGSGYSTSGVPLLASNGDLYESTNNGFGSIVQITPAGKLSVLYSFAGGTADGTDPGTLVQGPNGNLYGVTSVGGPTNTGSIFELTLGGAETVLHFFTTGGSNALNPSSPLLLASDGNFYGVTSAGGTSGDGTLYRISPAGAYTVLYSFPIYNGSALSIPEGPLIQASNGELVGTCYDGGTGGAGGVFTFDLKTDTETDLAMGVGTFSSPQNGVVQASDGNFYGVTTYSGSNVLFEVTPTGTASVVYNFNSGGSGAFTFTVGAGQLALGSDGDLYGAAGSGGSGNAGGVYRLDPTTGTLTSVYAFSGASGTTAEGAINGLSVGSNGWLYGTFNGPLPGGLFAID